MDQEFTHHRSDIELLFASATVSVEVASRLLGIGRSTAHRSALQTGEVAPGVPVVRPSIRRVRVPCEPLIAYLGMRRTGL